MASTKKKENMEDSRGNVILLTVIAIATMVVVVIGATFAYLSSSVDSSATSNIGVTTNGTSDLFLITVGDKIELKADDTNFGENDGTSQVGSTVATVTLKTAGTEASYDYSIYMDLVSNDFEYSSGLCYNTARLLWVDVPNEAECRANNNLWGTSDGIEYKCYSYSGPQSEATAEYAGLGIHDNEISCTAVNQAFWAKDNNPELHLTLYKSDGSITGETACQSANGLFENDICYTVAKEVDLTEARPVEGSENEIELLPRETISVSDANAKNVLYKAVATFEYFEHNQIVNAKKTFAGVLKFVNLTIQETD